MENINHPNMKSYNNSTTVFVSVINVSLFVGRVVVVVVVWFTANVYPLKISLI